VNHLVRSSPAGWWVTQRHHRQRITPSSASAPASSTQGRESASQAVSSRIGCPPVCASMRSRGRHRHDRQGSNQALAIIAFDRSGCGRDAQICVRTGREQPHGMLQAGVGSGSPLCNFGYFQDVDLKVKICGMPNAGQRKIPVLTHKRSLHGQQVWNGPAPNSGFTSSSRCGSGVQQEGRDLGTPLIAGGLGQSSRPWGWRNWEVTCLGCL